MDDMKKETEEVTTEETEAPVQENDTPEEKEEQKPQEEKERKSIFSGKNKEIEKLKEENAKLAEQVGILKNEYAKAYADTENTRKRLTKEYEQLSKYSMQKFALSVLPVLDDCERALAQKTSDEVYRKGVEMIYNKLKAALEAEGVTEIEAENVPFDGNWHQALMAEHVEGVEPGMVVQVLQKGYKLKDRILRAAMVKVSE